jgi:uncharacterized membrane protein YoaK (UPF0700 family)
MAHVNTFLSEVRQTIMPDRGGKFGPLPPLFLTMTVVTGLVDSFSYLALGHVFVANMTGNVVLLAFAFVGAKGFSILGSLLALVAFGAGALIAGRVCARLALDRARLLGSCTTIQAVFVGLSVLLTALSGTPVTEGFRYGLIVVLAVSMGIQNAAARKLAVPDITTTVLTMTITGIAADGPLAEKTGARVGRRGLTIVAMLVGALVGAAFVVHSEPIYPLAIALITVVAVSAITRVLGARDPGWSHVDP